jgi:hypothetical protein
MATLPRATPPATMKVRDSISNAICEIQSRKVFTRLQCVEFTQVGDNVSAGVAFRQPEFSSGYLCLPPSAEKQMEEAPNYEIFCVVSRPSQ